MLDINRKVAGWLFSALVEGLGRRARNSPIAITGGILQDSLHILSGSVGKESSETPFGIWIGSDQVRFDAKLDDVGGFVINTSKAKRVRMLVHAKLVVKGFGQFKHIQILLPGIAVRRSGGSQRGGILAIEGSGRRTSGTSRIEQVRVHKAPVFIGAWFLHACFDAINLVVGIGLRQRQRRLAVVSNGEPGFLVTIGHVILVGQQLKSARQIAEDWSNGGTGVSQNTGAGTQAFETRFHAPIGGRRAGDRLNSMNNSENFSLSTVQMAG